MGYFGRAIALAIPHDKDGLANLVNFSEQLVMEGVPVVEVQGAIRTHLTCYTKTFERWLRTGGTFSPPKPTASLQSNPGVLVERPACPINLFNDIEDSRRQAKE